MADATAAAKKAGVPIDSIAFGTASGTVLVEGEAVGVPADPEAMAAIADGSGGESFTAVTSDELDAVYEQIRLTVGYDLVPRDLTPWFLGLGLVLLDAHVERRARLDASACRSARQARAAYSVTSAARLRTPSLS